MVTTVVGNGDPRGNVVWKSKQKLIILYICFTLGVECTSSSCTNGPADKQKLLAPKALASAPGTSGNNRLTRQLANPFHFLYNFYFSRWCTLHCRLQFDTQAFPGHDDRHVAQTQVRRRHCWFVITLIVGSMQDEWWSTMNIIDTWTLPQFIGIIKKRTK